MVATEIQPALLGEWLRQNLEGEGDCAIDPIGEGRGIANVLVRVRWSGHDLVLRRPPAQKVTESAGNISREVAVLTALGRTDVPHPRLVASCDDPSVAGAPFLLMERVDGYPGSDPLPAEVDADPGTRHALGLALVDALAELALVDWRSVGLADFGKPEGFLERQVDRWLWQLDTYRLRDLPSFDFVVDWLRSNLPEPGPIGIMHGDYSMGNVLFAPESPTRVAAILDWDTATIGEVLMDFGHVLARWDHPGEAPTTLGSSDLPNRDGLATRGELVERFASRTGFDLASIRYYQVLALFKLVVIMEGHFANFVKSGATEMGRFTNIGPGLALDAARIANGDRT